MPKRSFRAVDSPRRYISCNSKNKPAENQFSEPKPHSKPKGQAESQNSVCFIHHSVWPFLNHRLQLPEWIVTPLLRLLYFWFVKHTFLLPSFSPCSTHIVQPPVLWRCGRVAVEANNSRVSASLAGCCCKGYRIDFLVTKPKAGLTLENLSHPVQSHTEPFAKSLNIKYFTS